MEHDSTLRTRSQGRNLSQGVHLACRLIQSRRTSGCKRDQTRGPLDSRISSSGHPLPFFPKFTFLVSTHGPQKGKVRESKREKGALVHGPNPGPGTQQAFFFLFFPAPSLLRQRLFCKISLGGNVMTLLCPSEVPPLRHLYEKVLCLPATPPWVGGASHLCSGASHIPILCSHLHKPQIHTASDGKAKRQI